MSQRDLTHICLIIATFRQDDAVIALLEEAYGEGTMHPFCHIIVVDSMGSGALTQAVNERGWQGITYENGPENLGSAGNLARRLVLASQHHTAQWAYALNHDGELDWQTLEALVKRADTLRDERVGALYPLRYTTHLKKYNLTGTSSLPIPYVGTTTRPTGESFPVYWASSNGAFYHLDPVRQGLTPWPDLWMGWEDLGYGWLLHQHGWHQEVVCGAVFEDGYEYKTHGTGQAAINVSDKPTWYAYYQMRNLILVTRRNARGPVTWACVAGRVGLELGLSMTLRKDKPRRMKFLFAGIQAGLTNQTGKWTYP